MSDIINEVLIRLKNIDNDHDMFSAFYTNNPSEYLKMYYFCQKNDISVRFENIEGLIEDIRVSFGGNDNIPCVDVWIHKW